MDNEDAPNFSYAYGGSTASAPSWNPALRPDHEEPAAAAPPIPPKTNSSLHPNSEFSQSKPESEPEGEDDDELPVAPAIPAHVSSSGAFDENPVLNSDDDFFDRYGPPQPSTSTPQHS